MEIKIKIAKTLLPELEMFQKVTGEKAKVRFFEGRDGIVMIQKEIAREAPKFTDQIFNINLALKNFPVSKNDHRQVLRKKKIAGRTIIVYDPKEPIPKLPLFHQEERRYLPENKAGFNSEFVLFNNKAVILSIKGNWMGVIIENKNMVEGLKYLFDLAWQGAEKYPALKD